MGLLQPESGLLFWMVISFGVVFVLLAKFGFPVITRMVEERRVYVEKSLEAAKQANEPSWPASSPRARLCFRRLARSRCVS